MVTLSYKTKQFFWLILKITIVFGCVFFIYASLTQNKTLLLSNFINVCKQSNLLTIENTSILFCFSLLNWIFEIKKWQIIVSSDQKIDFPTAAKQCLASLTVSLVTPNRVGEYIAKAMYYAKSKQKRIIGYNAMGNAYQLGVTIFFGFLGIVFLSYQLDIAVLNRKITIVIFIISGGCICTYLLIKRIGILKKWNRKWIVFTTSISAKTHWKVAFLSTLRYIMFSHQFYFIILLLHIDIKYFTAISAICSMYFISSFLPIISFLDVVVKSSVAIWIFSLLEAPPLLVLATTTLVWIFNFAIPAILGSNFVLRYTFKPAV